MGQRLLNNRNIATKNVESFRFLILFDFLQRSESAKKKEKRKAILEHFLHEQTLPRPLLLFMEAVTQRERNALQECKETSASPPDLLESSKA